MIAYLNGNVAAVSEGSLVIDVNNVGYQVYISTRDAAVMPPRGSGVRIYTWMSVSQDAVRLYGFLSEDDLEIFRLLLNVSGIGPKAALGILSVLSADDLRFAVLSDDAKAIAKANGVGAKSAQKVILELKDKFSLEDVFEHKFNEGADDSSEAGTNGILSGARDEAVMALSALGYSKSEAYKAIKKCDITEDMNTEDILKLALKQMI